jgi:hypothetical protein
MSERVGPRSLGTTFERLAGEFAGAVTRLFVVRRER